MRPHPLFNHFRIVLQRSLPGASSFRGTLYRACDPAYANTRDLLTGEGSRVFGGRWNAPNTFSTVYLAQRADGALAESLGLPGHYGFDPATRLPLTLVAVEAKLDRVFDFTDVRLRERLAVTIRAMSGCDWRSENAAGREAITQALGRTAFEIGIAGIIVPSAVKRTFRNLNVFPANLGTGRLKILGAEKLPPPSGGLV